MGKLAWVMGMGHHGYGSGYSARYPQVYLCHCLSQIGRNGITPLNSFPLLRHLPLEYTLWPQSNRNNWMTSKREPPNPTHMPLQIAHGLSSLLHQKEGQDSSPSSILPEAQCYDSE